MQISLDGATAEVNDCVRGSGSYATAITAMERLAEAGFTGFKLSVVVTRENVSQLDEFKALADRYDAQLRLTGCGRPGAAPTYGTGCTRPPPSSASSTSGCSPTGRTSSPVTRSFT